MIACRYRHPHCDYVVEVFGSADSIYCYQTYTHTTNAPTNSPPAQKADPSKWSGLNAFAFAVEVKRVAEIQSDFVAGAKS